VAEADLSIPLADALKAVSFITGLAPDEMFGFVLVTGYGDNQVSVVHNCCCEIHAAEVLAAAIKSVAATVTHDQS
jgi:hypothetical protein